LGQKLIILIAIRKSS